MIIIIIITTITPVVDYIITSINFVSITGFEDCSIILLYDNICGIEELLF